MIWQISTFYKFIDIENPEKLKLALQVKAEELGMRGLVVLGTEGVNSTIAASAPSSLSTFKKWLQTELNVIITNFKDSESQQAPFRRFTVKIREEIVTTGALDLKYPDRKNNHLSPEEWNEVLENDPDAIVVDTRNWYEYQLGTFERAINPDIEKFTEFPAFFEKKDIPKSQKILIFCTGGIRCDKGILELQRRGYEDVYQLEGGIIKYLQEFPRQKFKGECFVFDHRVAIDQDLNPTSKYNLCPHCGQPSEKEIICQRCDSSAKVCEDCLELEWKQKTCSKNCAYHLELHPTRKGARQEVV